jgi:hypothetical protein
MKKWFIVQNGLYRVGNKIWIIPCLSIWYDKDYFFETGVTSPAFGLHFAWLHYAYGLTIQKGY